MRKTESPFFSVSHVSSIFPSSNELLSISNHPLNRTVDESFTRNISQLASAPPIQGSNGLFLNVVPHRQYISSLFPFKRQAVHRGHLTARLLVADALAEVGITDVSPAGDIPTLSRVEAIECQHKLLETPLKAVAPYKKSKGQMMHFNRIREQVTDTLSLYAALGHYDDFPLFVNTEMAALSQRMGGVRFTELPPPDALYSPASQKSPNRVSHGTKSSPVASETVIQQQSSIINRMTPPRIVSEKHRWAGQEEEKVDKEEEEEEESVEPFDKEPSQVDSPFGSSSHIHHSLNTSRSHRRNPESSGASVSSKKHSTSTTNRLHDMKSQSHSICSPSKQMASPPPELQTSLQSDTEEVKYQTTSYPPSIHSKRKKRMITQHHIGTPPQSQSSVDKDVQDSQTAQEPDQSLRDETQKGEEGKQSEPIPIAASDDSPDTTPHSQHSTLPPQNSFQSSPQKNTSVEISTDPYEELV